MERINTLIRNAKNGNVDAMKTLIGEGFEIMLIFDTTAVGHLIINGHLDAVNLIRDYLNNVNTQD